MASSKLPEFPFPDMNKMLEQMKQFQVPGIDVNALIEGRRKDIEALALANQHVYEGIRLLAEKQQEIIKQAVVDWQNSARDVGTQGPSQLPGKQVEFAKKTFESAISSMRELAEVAAKSQAQAIEVVNKRVQENLNEIRGNFKQK
jgi:phasin family protein